MNMREPDFSRCYGWAYEPCQQPSKWVVVYDYPDHWWEAHPVCGMHASMILDSIGSEVQTPIGRTWVPVAEWGMIQGRLPGLTHES